MSQQADVSHQQLMQIRMDGDNERRKLEEAHHSKLAAEYRHHQSLESQIEQLKLEHIRYINFNIYVLDNYYLILFMRTEKWILWKLV